MTFKRRKICLGVTEFKAREKRKSKKAARENKANADLPTLTRDATQYKEAIKCMLEPYSLSPKNVMSFIADHDPTLRKAIRESGYALLGCGWHGLQLQPRHVLPPLKKKKRRGDPLPARRPAQVPVPLPARGPAQVQVLFLKTAKMVAKTQERADQRKEKLRQATANAVTMTSA